MPEKDDSPFSILGSSGKKSKQPDKTIQASPNAADLALQKAQLAKRDMNEMIDRMESLRHAIEEKVEEISVQKSLSKEKIWDVLSQQANFSREEWALIEKENKQLAERIWGIINKTSDGKTVRKPTQSKPNTQAGKFIGARRNWIPSR